MAKNPLFSVVMPVYKTEKYLKDAAQSILNQSFDNFELVLIDDGSPDNSPEICDRIAESDPRVRVVHKQKNEGLSEARNTGIDQALGEYVCFIDSDDTVEPNLLEKVNESLQEHKADAVMFGMTEEYFDDSGEIKQTFIVGYPAKSLNNVEELRNEIIHIEYSTLYGYSANKFFSLKLIKENKLKFEQVKLIEDLRFNIDFFNKARSLNILDATPYHYKKRGRGSLTEVFVPEYFEVHRERVFLLKKQHEEWGILTEEVKSLLGNIYSRYIFSAIQRNCDKRSGLNHAKRRAWVKELFQDELFNDLISFAKPDSAVFKIMTLLLKKKNVVGLLTVGRTIFLIKNKMPIFFAKAKQNR
ncbi:MAG TPA: glycosyltransferase family 2 protein [Clostridiales bacterium]|jgi:glycosyltransferase involved in cell wall biosynthesis|nr:glycosyltransferase family 2 protein [Clostridiales bacterium]